MLSGRWRVAGPDSKWLLKDTATSQHRIQCNFLVGGNSINIDSKLYPFILLRHPSSSAQISFQTVRPIQSPMVDKGTRRLHCPLSTIPPWTPFLRTTLVSKSNQHTTLLHNTWVEHSRVDICPEWLVLKLAQEANATAASPGCGHYSDSSTAIRWR